MKLRALQRASALAACVAACTPKHAPPTASKATASAATAAPPPKASAAPSSAVSCAAGSPAPLTAAAVTAFAERYRQTQRRPDVVGYSALYAEHFAGLLGADASYSRRDRATWLREREASFGSSSALGAASVRVAVGAGGAQIRFVSNAKEPGLLPELFVIPTNAGLQIVREAPARPEPSELTSTPGLWLADERFAILSTRPDPSWLEGAATFDGNGTALSNVALTRLPKAIRGLLGRPVRVLGRAGTVCETRLQRFAIRSQITPDLATAERWDGCGDAPISPDAIAEEIVRLTSNEGRTLVAELGTPCKGALLVADPNLPAPALAAPEPAAADLGETALAEMRKLPSYASVQARFKTEQPSAEGAWEDHDGRRNVWSLTLQGDSLVLASIAAGTGCSGFSGNVSAVWQAKGGVLRLLTELHAFDEKRVSPRALVDLGDGAPLLLLGPDGDYRAISLVSSHGVERLLTSVPFFAGPC